MPTYAKGDRVVQPTYGAGTLIEVDEHHTVIDFDQYGRRKFVTGLVVLESTNEPAPVQTRASKRPRATARKSTAPKGTTPPTIAQDARTR